MLFLLFFILKYSFADCVLILFFCISDTVIPPNSPNQRITIQRPIHLSQAVLNAPRNALRYSQVWVKCNNKMALIANLSDSVNQVRLDLAFGKGDTVQFLNDGDSDVHLSGYYLLDYEDNQQDEQDLGMSISLHCRLVLLLLFSKCYSLTCTFCIVSSKPLRNHNSKKVHTNEFSQLYAAHGSGLLNTLGSGSDDSSLSELKQSPFFMNNSDFQSVCKYLYS